MSNGWWFPGRQYGRHIAAISTCHGRVNVSATELSVLLHCSLGIGCRQNSINCDRQHHSDKLKTHLFCLTYGAESTAV